MINLNLNNENGIIDDVFYIFNKTGKRPNSISIDDLFSGDEFEKVLLEFTSDSHSPDDNIYLSELTPYDDQSVINQKVFRSISDCIWVSYIALNKDTDDFICNNVNIYYLDNDQVEDLKNKILSTTFLLDDENEETSNNKLFTLNISQNGLEIDPISFTPIDDCPKMYNSDTWKKVNSWIKKSKKTNSGISFFYGERGRGKTSILKYLSDKLDRFILYIPTNYLDHTINNPDFKNFLKNSKYLLVIDDAEVVCTYPNNILINNLHQLVDGILSESIGVQILLIYNGEIPSTILNVNNIIDKVEFKKITADQANELNKKKNFSNDVNLIDVFKAPEKEKGKISL